MSLYTVRLCWTCQAHAQSQKVSQLHPGRNPQRKIAAVSKTRCRCRAPRQFHPGISQSPSPKSVASHQAGAFQPGSAPRCHTLGGRLVIDPWQCSMATKCGWKSACSPKIQATRIRRVGKERGAICWPGRFHNTEPKCSTPLFPTETEIPKGPGVTVLLDAQDQSQNFMESKIWGSDAPGETIRFVHPWQSLEGLQSWTKMN